MKHSFYGGAEDIMDRGRLFCSFLISVGKNGNEALNWIIYFV